MIDIDKWQEVFNALRSNKSRTILTAIGVFWGILMLIILFGAGKGLENGVYDGMGDFATNSFFVWGQSTSKPFKGLPKGRPIEFDNSDTKAIQENISDIELIAPRVHAWGNSGENNIVRGKKTGAFNIIGDSPDFNKIDPLTITRGRFINEIDVQQLRKICVIGERVVQELFDEDENPIGEFIKLQGVYFQIVGTFKSKHKGGWRDYQEQMVFLPITTLQKTYNYGEQIHYFSFLAKKNVSGSIAEKEVIDYLKRRHSVHPDDDQAIGSHNLEEEFQKMNMLFLGIRILTWFVGAGTLLAGVIGVSNIMLVIVRERTQEIGIQRAIGATPWRVINQIVTEAITLTIIAGYSGLLIGMSIIGLVNMALPKSDDNMMFLNPGIDLKIALTALAILAISGVFAGLIPAKRAVSIKPIEAIRTGN